MNPINARMERFEAVELLGIPGLFTTGRVDRETIPPGMYAYYLQTSQDDWSQPCLLTRNITASHYGTVLTASPIPLSETDRLTLKPGDFHQPSECGGLTVAEFENKCLSLRPEQTRPPQARARRAPVR